MEIDAHIGCAMSGLTADARTMVDHARVTSQSHAFTYDEKMSVESCTQAVCDLALRFGESVEDDDALMVRAGYINPSFWAFHIVPSNDDPSRLPTAR
jgi:20S proteasome subunit alpha 5